MRRLDVENRNVPLLNEVFGIMQKVPPYTYVDRAGLDLRLEYHLGTDRHIVIYGASKQGKTSLRRRGLPDEKTVVVRCRLTMKLEDLYSTLLQNLGVYAPKERSKTRSVTGKVAVEVAGKAGLPLIGSASAKVGGELGGDAETEDTVRVPGMPEANLDWIAAQVRESNKRVVVEDFHYLIEDERRRFAFDLKALWDAGVFVIVIGIWAEADLLTFLNGDLSGRVENIDLVWNEAELDKVLQLGEQALNIVIEPTIRRQLIEDAAENVGLLQRLAERLCSACGVYRTEEATPARQIGDDKTLAQTRTDICRQQAARYKQFSDAVTRGFKQSEAGLRVYEFVVRVCLESNDVELINGIPKDIVLRRVQLHMPHIRMSDLSGALNRLDRLQTERNVSPLVFTFAAGKIMLVDRELLFFRTYGDPVWPWANEEQEKPLIDESDGGDEDYDYDIGDDEP